jgi:hypothetical protein
MPPSRVGVLPSFKPLSELLLMTSLLAVVVCRLRRLHVSAAAERWRRSGPGLAD